MAAKKKIEKKFRKRFIACLLITIAIIAVGYFIASQDQTTSTGSSWEPIIITKESLPNQLIKFAPVKNLPEDASLSLTIGEDEYAIEKGQVVPGAAVNPDASLWLPEEYYEIFGERGWCPGIRTAIKNNHIRYELHKSTFELGLKYRKLAKYRSCIE